MQDGTANFSEVDGSQEWMLSSCFACRVFWRHQGDHPWKEDSGLDGSLDPSALFYSAFFYSNSLYGKAKAYIASYVMARLEPASTETSPLFFDAKCCPPHVMMCQPWLPSLPGLENRRTELISHLLSHPFYPIPLF